MVNTSEHNPHIPVMLKEVLQFASAVAPKRILDGTFGRGGHTLSFLQTFPAAQVVALDRDREAIAFAQSEGAPSELRQALQSGRLLLEHFNFHQIRELPKQNGFDVILLDLGVSSPQLDISERGFSFYHDGPLDMRMDQTQEFTAQDVVNGWSEVELLDLFVRYGEIRRPQRVVRAIVHDRKENPFTGTRQLAGLIERVEGWRNKGHHPATRYFLALRMAVNDELAGLEKSLRDLMESLNEGGRLIVLTFHSLEDRIIKYAFKEAHGLGFPVTKKVVVPEREEESRNPRARSAKLRVFQREGHHE